MKIFGLLFSLGLYQCTDAFTLQLPEALGARSWKIRASPASPSVGSLGSSPKDQTGTSRVNYPISDPPMDTNSMANGGGTASSPSDAYTKNLQSRLESLEKPSSDGKELWDESEPILVQGATLKTWSFASAELDSVQVKLQTDGRPLEADVELWQGPDNTPHKLRVYVEDGSLRPFTAKIMTPRGPNTIAIRNIGELEFPLSAFVIGDATGTNGPLALKTTGGEQPRLIQGGALRTYPFDSFVDSIQILLATDGRPLNTRIELLQGPNNIKQVVECYTEDGLDRPFFLVIESPGTGNVVRIVNTSTMEFPLTALVEAYEIGDGDAFNDPVIGGDNGANGQLNFQW